ncbi:MAG: HD domain-containing phosphohydrolase [Actinomycetota bacterium]
MTDDAVRRPPSPLVYTGAPKDARILIVDDEPQNVRLLEEILARAGFEGVLSTTDPRRCLGLLAKEHPDLILLDLLMPHLDGYAVLDALRREIPAGEYLPILVLTNDLSTEAKRRALSMGAMDFLAKPFDVTEVVLRVKNLLHTRSLQTALANQNDLLEDRVKERTQHMWEAMQRLAESEAATREAIEETVRHLAAAAELRDEETGWHIQRMSRYSALLAGRLGMPPDRCELIRLASSMHDVGKIGVPDRILGKRGKLTPAEMEQMRAHAEVGHRVLAGSKAEVLDLAAMIALTHHERFDGTGYPRGLARFDVPLEARIAAVADVFDALTSDRVYRRAFALGEAVEMMRSESGRHFDPELLDLFLGSLDEVLEIWQSYADDRRTATSTETSSRRPRS